MIGQTVGDDEPLAVLDVQIPHGGELLRARRVEDLEDAGRVVHLDLLAVKVLDRRVVFLHEVARDELNGEGGFADAAGAQHDHLELSHGVLTEVHVHSVVFGPTPEGNLFLFPSFLPSFLRTSFKRTKLRITVAYLWYI